MALRLTNRLSVRVPDQLLELVNDVRKAKYPYWTVSDVVLAALRRWALAEKPDDIEPALTPSSGAQPPLPEPQPVSDKEKEKGATNGKRPRPRNPGATERDPRPGKKDKRADKHSNQPGKQTGKRPVRKPQKRIAATPA